MNKHMAKILIDHHESKENEEMVAANEN